MTLRVIINGNQDSTVNGIVNGTANMLQTGQTTVYTARDDADILAGIAKPTASYDIKTAGSQSGTTAVYVPTLVRNDISFDNATGKILAPAGLNVVKTGDVIRIRGSSLNETEYTVTTGNVATEIVTTVAPVTEAAGAYITIAKQALQSNNTVRDLNTNLTWLRYPTNSPAKLGIASDGKLTWTALTATVHPAAADLQMVAGGKGSATVYILGGAGEVLRYWPGYSYSFTGFANAVNNLPGFRCTSVADIGGGALAIGLATGNQTCIAEAAAGARTINLSVNGIWSFANAAIAASVGGYSDWRVPNSFELLSIQTTAGPNSTAFPGYGTVLVWSSSTTDLTTSAFYTGSGHLEDYIKTEGAIFYGVLVRGGV